MRQHFDIVQTLAREQIQIGEDFPAEEEMLEFTEAQRGSIERTDGEENAELEEITMVQMSHTIVDPRTMMILVQDTSSTDGTVMSPRWFRKDTLSTDIGSTANGRE